MKQHVDGEFEHFIKTNADELRMHPSPQVWKNIHAKLHHRKRNYIAAGLALLLIGSTTAVYFTQKAAGNRQSIAAVSSSSQASKQVTGNTPASPGSISVGRINTVTSMPAAPVQDNNAFIQRQQPASLQNSAGENTLPVSIQPEAIADNPGDKETVIVPAENDAQRNTGISGNFTENTRNEIRNDITETFTDKAPGDGFREIPAADLLNNRLKGETPERLTPENKDNDLVKNFPPRNLASMENTTGNIRVTPKLLHRVTTEFYVSPSISYRKLTDSRDKNQGNTQNDLDRAIFHKPSMGLEAGVSWHFRMDDHLRLKGGLQVNYNRFNMKATRVSIPEVAKIVLYGNNPDINNASTFRTDDRGLPEWLKNKNIQLSIPLGVEYALTQPGTGKPGLSMGLTAQPSYLLGDKNYILSTDLKNYTQESSLTRRFNVNIGLETFFTFQTEKLRWHVGPQLRYQVFSTYNKIYPIRENLIDYSFKIAISKPFR